MMRQFLILLFVLAGVCACAQETSDSNPDSTYMNLGTGDTVRIESTARAFSPRKALLYSAVLPGLGQAYNRKYWKIPLVYGGFVGIGYGLNWYHNLLKDYKGQLFYILETGETKSLQGFTETQLRPAIDRARRERDFMVVLMAGMYLLQIVDAHVDAHLKEFDLNPNLQVQVQPMMETSQLLGRQNGFSLTFTF